MEIGRRPCRRSWNAYSDRSVSNGTGASAESEQTDPVTADRAAEIRRSVGRDPGQGQDDFDAAHEQAIALAARLLKAADDRAASRGVQVCADPPVTRSAFAGCRRRPNDRCRQVSCLFTSQGDWQRGMDGWTCGRCCCRAGGKSCLAG